MVHILIGHVSVHERMRYLEVRQPHVARCGRRECVLIKCQLEGIRLIGILLIVCIEFGIMLCDVGNLV